MTVNQNELLNAVAVIKLAASASADVAAAVKEGRKSIGPVIRKLILADRAQAEHASTLDQPNQHELPGLSGLIDAVMDGLAKDSRRKARQYVNSMLAGVHKSMSKAAAELGQLPPPKLAVYGETDSKLWVAVQPIKRITSEDAKAAALKVIQQLQAALDDVSKYCTDDDAAIVSAELNSVLESVDSNAAMLAEAA